jgi:hypothetical protein
VCPLCGKNLTGSASTNHTGKKYNYYQCQDGCKTRFSASKANKIFEEYLNELKVSNEVSRLYQIILVDYHNQVNKEVDNKKSFLQKEIDGF